MQREAEEGHFAYVRKGGASRSIATYLELWQDVSLQCVKDAASDFDKLKYLVEIKHSYEARRKSIDALKPLSLIRFKHGTAGKDKRLAKWLRSLTFENFFLILPIGSRLLRNPLCEEFSEQIIDYVREKPPHITANQYMQVFNALEGELDAQKELTSQWEIYVKTSATNNTDTTRNNTNAGLPSAVTTINNSDGSAAPQRDNTPPSSAQSTKRRRTTDEDWLSRPTAPYTRDNTHAAQQLAGTSDQEPNALQGREDGLEESLDGAQPPPSTNTPPSKAPLPKRKRPVEGNTGLDRRKLSQAGQLQSIPSQHIQAGGVMEDQAQYSPPAAVGYAQHDEVLQHRRGALEQQHTSDLDQYRQVQQIQYQGTQFGGATPEGACDGPLNLHYSSTLPQDDPPFYRQNQPMPKPQLTYFPPHSDQPPPSDATQEYHPQARHLFQVGNSTYSPSQSRHPPHQGLNWQDGRTYPDTNPQVSQSPLPLQPAPLAQQLWKQTIFGTTLGQHHPHMSRLRQPQAGTQINVQFPAPMAICSVLGPRSLVGDGQESQPWTSAAILSAACKESGYPQRPDGRNFGVEVFTVHTLHKWWKSMQITFLKVEISNHCATLSMMGLELKFAKDSSLLLAQSVKGADAITEDLPNTLGLDPLSAFLKKNVLEPLVFFFGSGWLPEPLAEVKSPRVTVTMIGQEPTPLFRDLIVARNQMLAKNQSKAA